jgi:hypothetical protein
MKVRVNGDLVRFNISLRCCCKMSSGSIDLRNVKHLKLAKPKCPSDVSEGAPMLEQLLIQHAALCWLRLTLAELV